MQECTHRIERAVVVTLRCAGADAAQNGEEVAPVRDPFGCPVPSLDFLDVRALDVFPPAGTAQVCRQAGHHQRLVLVCLVAVVAGLLGLIHHQEGELGMKHSGRSADINPPVVEAGWLRVLGECAAIVIDRQVVNVTQRILKLQQPHLVHLAEALREEQRQHLQLEEPRIEVERGEHRTSHPPATHCLCEPPGEYRLRQLRPVRHGALASCRVMAFSESMK